MCMWLSSHVQGEVLPKLFAIAKAHRELQRDPKFWHMQDVNVVDRAYPVRNIRPMRGYRNPELGMLAAALKSIGIDHYVSRLDEEPQISDLHTIVKNSLKSLRRILKKPGRRLLLPGRDVWLWSVLAHKMNIPHMFDARISRLVARDHVVLKEIADGWRLTQNTIVFDTGFAGSIYNHICQATGKKPINLMLSTLRSGEQLWPTHKGARGKALTIEKLPKYQKTGTLRDGRATQWLANLEEYIQAAILTIWFWYHESPAWIPQGDRCKVIGCRCKSCNLWR